MSIPTLDEQFLPRLLAVFYAVFHPTEGPKVIYQVPEGSITEDKASAPATGANATASTSKVQLNQGGVAPGAEPLFDFSALSEYLIPKAPLCGRLVTSIARGVVGVQQKRHERPTRALSRAPARSSSARSGGSSRAPSVKPRRNEDADTSGKPQLEERIYKILGFPILIEDATKYQRNNFIFNLCFVFEGNADVRAYEPVVRKCGRVLRGLEESQSFLSSPKSLPRMYSVVEQLFEDLNSYSESFVALPEAPHTSYLNSSSKPFSPEGHSQNHTSPPIGPEDFVSLGASFGSLRGEHHRNSINERLKLKQLQQHQQAQTSSPRQIPSPISDRASPTHQAAPGISGGARSRSGSGTGSSPHDHARPALAPLTTIRGDGQAIVRSNSASGTSGPGSDGPHSPQSGISIMSPDGRRPSLARSSTIAGLTDDAGRTAYPSGESRDTAMGIVSSKGRSDLSHDLSAAESLGNVLTHRDIGAYDSVNTAAGTRRSSRGSTAGAHGPEHEPSALEHLTESVLSLRTIDAALTSSVNALRTETGDGAKRTAFIERREPPHGLGRTVRDAINLKLFPVFANPTPVNDWDVPVALLDLLSRVDGNWDLTLRRILPFIDGVNHVKRIAQLADADLGLTRACLEHLVYYGCIIVVDIFQYFNMYTVRPIIATKADEEALGLECATYVARSGYTPPSYPDILKLYSLLRVGTTLHDWIEDNDIDSKGIDVRRFVSFGVIQGFLRRVHRYPIYLGSRSGEDGFPAFDTSVVNTVRNSPVVQSPALKSNDASARRSEAQDSHRREQSGSREPRDRRPRELSGMSGAYSAFQRIGRDGSVDSPGVAARTSARRPASEVRLSNVALAGGSASAFHLGSESVQTGSGAGSSQFGTSPTKRHARMRQRTNYRHPTTTAVDVAAAAFQAERPATAAPGGTARSPRKRASAIGLSTAIPSTASTGALPSASGSGIAGTSGSHPHPRSNAVVIPPDLIDMLDGLHSDDEICVAFSISWPELEKMLIQIGLSPSARPEIVDTDEDDIASTQRSDWRRWPGGSMFGTTGAGGASSGWSKPRMSGFGAGVGGKSQASGVASSGHHSSRTQGGESSGFGMVWGNDPDESGWGPTGLDREAIEAGDLGRVRILYQ